MTSPLTPAILVESCSTAGVAAANAESRKHDANVPKCVELGWICIPLAVEAYGNWGKEAQEAFSQLASLLAAHYSVPKSKAAAVIYGRLNLTLTRSVARAILARGSKANIIRECIYNSLLRFVYVCYFIVCMFIREQLHGLESTVQSHKIICHHPRFPSYADHNSDSFFCKFCRNASRS